MLRTTEEDIEHIGLANTSSIVFLNLAVMLDFDPPSDLFRRLDSFERGLTLNTLLIKVARNFGSYVARMSN